MKNLIQAIHPDLLLAQELAYIPNGYSTTNIQVENESSEYGACNFHLNGRYCKFRAGKATPKKPGFFVTIWKRSPKGPITPFDLSDPIDLFIFSVHTNEHFGQFVFPKTLLVEKGVLSNDGKGGKRAIRVYPPWTITTSNQAKLTQSWQEDYYYEISKNNKLTNFILDN